MSDAESSQHEGESRLFVSPIASPVASDKLVKKLLKLTKKMTKDKKIKKGIKETTKATKKKGSKGLVLIAADISPVDVLTHLPIMCEAQSVPYIYVPSREAIGGACSTKRPTACVFLECPEEDSKSFSKFEQCVKLVKKQNPYL
ncbi:unnamed protein product [Moneuplotes crassus]|uniref:H/ACA ribonucleoprotein complex subunit 2 n=1 Tax=Euplotes crassus TaxID=5936 RepID=A0AAD1Y443_EUPCR|nr:unnamed protein product [Moneuplotes crassus]